MPPMTDHYSPQSARGPVRALRLLALTVVGAGVIVLLAAAFVLSYPGIHAMALHAGVSPRLARGYPVIFDAVLAIACAALLALRGGGLVSRCYAWLSLLVVLAGAAGADALHSTGTRLPHRPAAATAAVLPWVLALIGFGLLLAVLRHARKLAVRQAQDGPSRGAARGAAAQGMPAQYVPPAPPTAPYPPHAPPHVPALEAAPATTGIRRRGARAPGPGGRGHAAGRRPGARRGRSTCRGPRARPGPSAGQGLSTRPGFNARPGLSAGRRAGARREAGVCRASGRRGAGRQRVRRC